MDRRTWWATVREVEKSWMRLSTQTHHFVGFLSQQIHDEDGFLVKKLRLPLEGILKSTSKHTNCPPAHILLVTCLHDPGMKAGYSKMEFNN